MNENIDLQKIADELDFDLEDVEMLMEVFIESAEESLVSLKKAIDIVDYENIFMSAHSIKGSSANLMLNDISTLAKEIEFSAHKLIDIDYVSKFDTLQKMILLKLVKVIWMIFLKMKILKMNIVVILILNFQWINLLLEINKNILTFYNSQV